MNSGGLPKLRTYLSRLRRRRRAVRALCGVTAVLLALGGLLLALFIGDWLLHFNRGERGALLAGLAAAMVWAVSRWLHKPLQQTESELQLALELERTEQLEGDLAAALQFDAGSPGEHGSSALEQAVVTRVAAWPALPVPAADPNVRVLRRRSLAFLAGAALATGLLLAFPIELRVFAKRMFLLSGSRYPTRTIVAAFRVNGVDVSPTAPELIRVPAGRPVRFELDCRGELPDDGIVRLKALNSDQEAQVPLKPVPSEGTARYVGDFERLLEPVSYRIRIGDAAVDAGRIEVIPFPALALELTATPPRYAADKRQTTTVAGGRQLAVLEGSRVDLLLQCENKPLRAATLRVAGREVHLEADESRRSWRLPRTETPLARVAEPLQFEIAVEDEDGLASENPLRVAVSLEPDHPPRVAAGVVTDRVLPAAEPTLSWGASDDYGLKEVRVHCQIVRMAGEAREESLPLYRVKEGTTPATTARNRQPLPMASWKVSPGDEIRLTVEATDARGESAGASARSEPIVLHVTDENGILAALAETDEKSSRELDEIIQRELGIGDVR